MKRIITIAREYGAGGRSIGRSIAKKMGLSFYDRDLILKTAEMSTALNPEDVRVYEEKLSKVSGVAQSLFDFYSRPLSDQIWDAQIEAIRNIADHENCVIVGRNAGYILREFDHCLRVFLYADKDWRVQHMKELYPEIDPSRIESEMLSIDRSRQAYCLKYTGKSYDASQNYDLCINVAKIGMERAEELIISLANEL